MAMELRRAANRNDIKGFYNGLKEVWGHKKKEPVHLKSTDGMETFSHSKNVVARCDEHFQKLLNVAGDIYHEALDNIPQGITKTSRDDIPAFAGLKDGIPTVACRRQSVQQTAPTNHQCLGGWCCTISMEECQHCNYLLEI